MNIITTIKKEIEKGNRYCFPDGNTVSDAKMEQLAKKDFMADMKAGKVAGDVSFNKYFTDWKSSHVIALDTIINVLETHAGLKEGQGVVKKEETPADQTPETETN